MSSVRNLKTTFAFFLFSLIIMQASQLPFEIIACIARFLTVKQKLSCITVCQAWRTPFEESLWDTIVVGSRARLESICDLTDIQHNVYRKNGHLVRVLKLMILLRDDQLRIVQECFCSLKQLNTIGRSLTKSSLEAEVDWSYWSSLTCLIIQIDDLKIQIPVEKLLEILSFLPCLKHLDYFKPIWSPNPIYTLQDFEALHNYLPQLKRLSVSANFAEFTPNDITYITQNTFHVKHLAELFIDSCQVDLRWLYYFARKYPNLNTIKWRNSDWKVPTTIFKEEAAVMISRLPCMFPHIKTVLNMNALPKEWVKTVFWDPLSRSGALLNYMRHGLYREHNTTDKAQLCSSESMRSCLKSIESLYVEAESFFSDPCSIPMAFDFCRSLVNLDIDIHGSPIAIDLLLDRCDSLKKLKLIVSSVTTASDIHSHPNIHGLQSIEFEKATISAIVLHYISFRCIYLKCMRMNTIKVFGKFSHDTKSLLIDMSYTRFNLLQLNNVMFYASSSGICDSGNAINILQLVRPNLALQPIKTHDLSMILPRGGLLTMLLELRWFHIYKICKFYYNMVKLRIFGTEESQDSKTSFESYHHVNKLRVGHREVTSYACNQDYSNGSVKDINRGYASLRCGYVKKYDMGNLDNCEKLTLENSCKTM
ncbi:hypothetical protein J3Q64DRAFT_1771287 [Phycomyces blakesleeanus]|uniref:F-box domain-containing protein n=2 Tax=Phycomyces blakesleeanus TaxID=4837 RepID=A0A162TW04_PHYB8|nr:hypothetical protein PHYBLDRAFT_170787 [Phycomyces blakesleeanus NRRL 1555(-)]OAD71422.1 hypothetical protein PHYBLDRAFT_170787 [Phycomyces blakesleeanus NRRL 1555(-)]|eukprot:XP_018289462.1 hypothetical protein PHYBLDRAFT_170787 [Phycomyces blakesleeanus NRRL 1555(-)]